MLRHAFAAVASILYCATVHAQWSSFKSVTKDLLPRDQREIDQQTIVDGKVTPKEIRVDWYGFDLENGTNRVLNRYQYPVADPTLAPGDKIIRIRTTDVKDADSVTAALRATPDADAVPIVVERLTEGSVKTEKITLYRANSLVLSDLLKKKLSISPPFVQNDDAGVWGEARLLSFQLIAIADDGRGVFKGTINVVESKGRTRKATGETVVRVENVLLRGWDVSGMNVGEFAKLNTLGNTEDYEPSDEARQLVLKSGSSGSPGQKTPGGIGFLYPETRVKPRYIFAIGQNETVHVDGKKLKVSVLINME